MKALQVAWEDRIVEAMSDYNHEFPLIENHLTKAECHGIADKLGLKRPAMYDLGYPNNNCIGHNSGDCKCYSQALHKTMAYLRFLLNDASIIAKLL